MNHVVPSHTTTTGPLSIDCDACVRQDTDTCSDCVVTFLVSRQPSEAVIIDVAEFAALRRLQTAGLVPGLRHQAAVR